MINTQKEINEVLKIIKEKTGVVVSPNMIVVEKTDRMEDNKCLLGTYSSDKELIYINPSIFEIITDEKYYREKARFDLVDWKGEISHVDTEEKFQFYMSENIRKEILWHIDFVIAHEIGHYIHDKFFHNQAMRIPIKGGFGTNGRNSRKNPLENFADGFAEYVLDLFWKKDSKRAIRMDNIINQLKTT